MKKEISQIRLGTVLSYINLALGNLIPLVYTPVMLRMLGQSEYGLYTLAHSVVGYLSLLSFGIGGTIVRYLAKARAKNDKEEEAKIAGLFLKIYSVLAIIVVIAGVAIAKRVDFFFGKTITTAALGKMQYLVLLMAVNTAITFPTSVFSSVIIANERFIFNKLMAMMSSILVPCLNLGMLYLGFGSVGMTVTTTIATLLTFIGNASFCYKRIGIRVNFKKTESGLVKEIAGFSAFVFFGEVVNMLYWATDKVLIGAMIGTHAVAVYNIGATFNGIMQTLGTSVSSLFTPRIVISADNGDETYLNETLIKIGRIQYYIIALILTGFIVFGAQFIELWVGNEYSQAYYVALLVMIPLTIPLIQSIALQIAVAKNMHRFRAVVYLFVAILNVVGTVLLIPPMGIKGAAWATCIAYVIGPVFIMNWYYHKKLHINMITFWKNIFSISIVPIVLMMAGIFIFKPLGSVSWISFFVGVIIYTLLYCGLSWIFSFNEFEKNIFLIPVKAIFRR